MNNTTKVAIVLSAVTATAILSFGVIGLAALKQESERQDARREKVDAMFADIAKHATVKEEDEKPSDS